MAKRYVVVLREKVVPPADQRKPAKPFYGEDEIAEALARMREVEAEAPEGTEAVLMEIDVPDDLAAEPVPPRQVTVTESPTVKMASGT